ncbi:MAG: ABC transporter permease [Lentimicrobiaceae bacterium]|nr:ABC transporter permease [Lentimicrobiaceae bacterium]
MLGIFMLRKLGDYLILISQAFRKPDKALVFRKRLLHEFYNLGFTSIGIVLILSVFVGAVATILVAYNIDSPLIPEKMVGFTARQMIILEFSPTIISLILAGKLGSQIASEIGSMRVTQQIDALQVMGINTANYLILPKIIASLLFIPVLIIFSIVIGILGGWLACIVANVITPTNYVIGLRAWFEPFSVTFAMIKTVVFAFLISSISSYIGYSVKGGSVEVGKASTQAVVISSIAIIIFDLILTQMLLT